MANHPLLERARRMGSTLEEIRQDFHQFPELGYKEVRTATRCAAAMRQLGYSVRTDYARTGFVADLPGNSANGRLIVIRVEMDALPIEEESTVEYRSQNEGVMHACGHDAHMAMAIGAASLLKAQERLPGSIRFVFQPCEETADEEGKGGGLRMVEEGAVDGAYAVIAQHGMPDIPMGQVAILDGPVMASSSNFRIVVTGKGGHIAESDKTIDALLLACQIRVNIAMLLKSCGLQAIIGIGEFSPSVNVRNIVPERVTLQGSIRTLQDSNQARCEALLRQACTEALAQFHGAEVTLNFLTYTPVTESVPLIAAHMRQAARAILGDGNVIETKPRFTAEDFAFYKRKAPTAFMLTGTGTRRPTALHTSDYDVSKEVLPIGAAILAETALRLMQG